MWYTLYVVGGRGNHSSPGGFPPKCTSGGDITHTSWKHPSQAGVCFYFYFFGELGKKGFFNFSLKSASRLLHITRGLASKYISSNEERRWAPDDLPHWTKHVGGSLGSDVTTIQMLTAATLLVGNIWSFLPYDRLVLTCKIWVLWNSYWNKYFLAWYTPPWGVIFSHLMYEPEDLLHIRLVQDPGGWYFSGDVAILWICYACLTIYNLVVHCLW